MIYLACLANTVALILGTEAELLFVFTPFSLTDCILEQLQCPFIFHQHYNAFPQDGVAVLQQSTSDQPESR